MSLEECNNGSRQTHTHTLQSVHSYLCKEPCTMCISPHRCKNPGSLVEINCFSVVEGLSWGTLREQSTAHDAVSLLWFFTLRRSISLMQSCRALASIKSNIYQEIKRGERETGQRMVLWHIEEMLRWRDLEKTEQKKNQKTPQQKTQMLLSAGVSQRGTCVSICRLFMWVCVSSRTSYLLVVCAHAC